MEVKSTKDLGLTKQREVVLRVIRDAHGHLTANEVFGAAKELLPSISFATVYNSLRFLKDAGHIAEISFGSGASRFDRITHQVLIYPSLDLDFDVDRYASLRENAEGYGIETAGLKPFNAFYFDSGADPADPLVSPIKRDDLTGLPPALIITAEHDPLRDEGELYGRRLQEAGVDATVSRYSGANHGFVANFAWIPEYYRAFAETAEFLNASEAR